jgi:RNA polymerase sigma factor for flagellar operon FliA
MQNLNFDSREYEQKLFEAYHKTGDKKALKLLVERHIGVVKSVAYKVYSIKSGMEYEDFVQMGLIGLLKSIDEYNPQSNAKFMTFAYPRIQGAMIDGMRDFNWLPRLVLDRSKKLKEAKDYLCGKESRSVSNIEVAVFLGLSRREYRDSSFIMMVSLEEVSVSLDGQKHTLKDVIPECSGRKPDKEAEKSIISEIVRKCLLSLPEREQKVIYRHYFKGETLQTIASSLGVDPSRVSLICKKARNRLRRSLARHGIGEWPIP